MQFEGLPPTTNHAYFDLVVGVGKKRHVQRVLTTEGKAYKKEVMKEVVTTFGLQIANVKLHVPYGFAIVLHSPSFLNRTYPTGAKNRFAKTDGSNRVKLLEDAVASALGIDDSQFFHNSVSKKPASADLTEVWVWELPDAEFGQP